MRLLAHPFRLEANGSAATVEDDTDEAHAQAIAILALTRRGERALVPGFGLTDPLFDRVALADLNLGLTDYGPAVRVTALDTTYPDDRTEQVVLTYTGQE